MGLFRFGFCAGILHFHDQPSGIIAVAAKDEEKGKGKAEEKREEQRKETQKGVRTRKTASLEFGFGISVCLQMKF